MNTETVYDRQRWTFPRVGQRIVKTSIAVFLCLVIYYLRGYEGGSMPTEAMITAILCMQPYVRDSRDYAVSRLTGTLIGAFWGLMFLLFLTAVHSEGDRRLILYAGMAVGVLVSLHSAVLIGKPDTAGLAAIVFLCVVIAFPDIEDPLRQAGLRIAGRHRREHLPPAPGKTDGQGLFYPEQGSGSGPLLPDPSRRHVPAELSV